MRKTFPVLKRRKAWLETADAEEEVFGLQENQDPLVVSFFQDIIIPIVEPEYYIQGQRDCPICNGVVNFTYSKIEGFTVYECSTNDCLPWPIGGAKKRREAGLPKITATRYQ